MTTRTELLTTYRAKVAATKDWAQDPAKLERFMVAVSNTVNGTPGDQWNAGDDNWFETLKEHGLPKRSPMKSLRALPA